MHTCIYTYIQEELDRALEYYQLHNAAVAEALDRCGGDVELFNQIAKEMVAEVLPGQVESLESAIHVSYVCLYM
jgi:hypothetical protein